MGGGGVGVSVGVGMGEDVAVAVTVGAGAAQAVNSRAKDKIRSWMDFMMMLSELGQSFFALQSGQKKLLHESIID